MLVISPSPKSDENQNLENKCLYDSYSLLFIFLYAKVLKWYQGKRERVCQQFQPNKF